MVRESRTSNDPKLSRKLREFRKEVAVLQGKPASAVFSDKILEQLVQQRPETMGQLESIIGRTHLRQRDKDKLLQMLRDH